jgi:hypothetical protein
MPLHFATFIKGTQSPGVLVVPQSLSVARVADDLLLIVSATQSDELWMAAVPIPTAAMSWAAPTRREWPE